MFFCVVFYGLFHGLCYLPVILSCIGPTPYSSSRVLPLQLSTLSLNPIDCPSSISDCPINNNNSKIILSKSNDLSLLHPDQLVLPWQPDHGSGTSGGDHVTKNKTVASTEDTHHYDKNFRRSIAGKVEDYIHRAEQRKCVVQQITFFWNQQSDTRLGAFYGWFAGSFVLSR